MYITLTKKRLFVTFCLLLASFLLLIQFMSAKAESVVLSTNAQRVEYIKSLGISLSGDDYTSKTVVIPQEFGAVYSKYNALQKEANFDLSNFRGKEVTIFTYKCNDQKVVNLIIFKDKLIGGDIAETRLNGSMTALKGDINGKGTVR